MHIQSPDCLPYLFNTLHLLMYSFFLLLNSEAWSLDQGKKARNESGKQTLSK